MKNAIRLTLTLVFASLTAEVSLAEQRSCPALVIKKSEVKSIVARRQTTFKHCLSCQGETCEFKDWPAEGQDFARACRLLFCAPTKMPQKMLLPEKFTKEAGIFFTYGIGKKGRIKDVEITDLIGDIEEEEALQMVNNYFERRRYEPIVVDGKTYELINLKDGTNYKWRTGYR